MIIINPQLLAAFLAAFFMPDATAEAPRWHAQAFLCPVLTPSKCVILDDTRGPYGSEEACQARAREMIRHAITWTGPVVRAGTRCSRNGQQEQERAT